MEGTDGMLEARVLGGRINDRSQSELFDAGESLHQRVLYDLQQRSTRYLDKTEYRIVDNLTVVHFSIKSKAYILQFLSHLLLQFTCLVASYLSKVIIVGSIDNAT